MKFITKHMIKLKLEDFLASPADKNPPANIGDTRSIPGPGVQEDPHALEQPSPCTATTEAHHPRVRAATEATAMRSPHTTTRVALARCN